MESVQPYKFKTITEYHRQLGLPKPEHPLISVVHMDSITPLITEGSFSLIFDFYSITLKRMYNAKFKYGQQTNDFDEGVLFFMSPGQVFGIELEKGTTHRYSRESQLASIMEDLAPIDAFKLLVENADAIEKFPQHRFTTSDGRTFGVFFDGERIVKLFEREAVSINRRDKAGLQRIKDLAGFILEISEDDSTDPVVYEHLHDLSAAWSELHRVHQAHYFLNVKLACDTRRFCRIFLNCGKQIWNFSVECVFEGGRSIKFILGRLGPL